MLYLNFYLHFQSQKIYFSRLYYTHYFDDNFYIGSASFTIHNSRISAMDIQLSIAYIQNWILFNYPNFVGFSFKKKNPVFCCVNLRWVLFDLIKKHSTNYITIEKIRLNL